MAYTHLILCSKCKKPGTVDTAECASCGGRVVRQCGACGFKNAAAKKYCDACGEDFSKVQVPTAPIPAAKAPPPAAKPEPKPAPRPEPKPAPPPEPKPEIKLPPIKPAAPAPKPPPEPKPAEAPRPPILDEPLELRPPDAGKPAKEAGPSKDEALERFMPKTLISRLPQEDPPKVDRVQRDDEPVPDMRPPEKPAESGDKPAGGPPKKERVKMRLESEHTPLPPEKPKEPAKEPPRKPEAKPDLKPERKPEPKPEPRPERKPGELDPRLVKGYEKHEKPPEKGHAAPPPKKVVGPTLSQTFIQRRPRAVLSTVVALVLLLTGFVAYYLKLKTKAPPGEALVKAGGDYLFALKQKDFTRAYSLLSKASQKAAGLEAFRKLQDDSSWTFDDIRAEVVAPGWALLRYKLYSGQGNEDDWLVMQFEDGLWRRAMWWPMMEDIEAALGRQDSAAAARLAREAQAIDPLDPMPVAYYCEAAYMAGDGRAALESCQKALKASETLPSRLGGDGIFRVHHIIADLDRALLKRPAEAAREFGILLAYPKLDEAQACDLHLARADLELELAQSDQALEDFRAAQTSCRVEADQAYAARSAAVLGGTAGAEAVAAAQASRMPGDEMSLAEWRTKTRAETAKRLKTRPADMPPETWTPVHKGGSLYSVTLKSGTSDVLSAEVDLFTRKVKVDSHAQ